MIWYAICAFVAGGLIILSRQVNGRLALHTSALNASFWNHAVGAAVLTVIGLLAGGLWGPGVADVPWWAWLGGTGGVLFIAMSSWLVLRLGAAQTALMIIAGQMICGVLLDLLRDAPGSPAARILGVGLIMAGMIVSHQRRR